MTDTVRKEDLPHLNRAQRKAKRVQKNIAQNQTEKFKGAITELTHGKTIASHLLFESAANTHLKELKKKPFRKTKDGFTLEHE